jgi:hypothetical protein
MVIIIRFISLSTKIIHSDILQNALFQEHLMDDF